ncbi:hypothetical protein K3495_g13809 [Podosphaera aphanis]|nr:hypothetical protein K3495_g13809 [Podosphaera aphanis]
MKEYQEWLDDRMKYRKILLLLDNFAGQELAVRLVGGLEGLQNVRVAWLPVNKSSHWQPLDQRIIASFKLAYRKQRINFILNQHESGKDPQKTFNILRAIQWSQISWEDLEIAGFFRDPIPIRDFLEPAEEIIVEKDSDIFEAIVSRYSIIDGDDDGYDNDGHDEFEEIRPSLSGASKAMDILQSFIFLGKNGGKSQFLKLLTKLATKYLKKGERDSPRAQLITG